MRPTTPDEAARWIVAALSPAPLSSRSGGSNAASGRSVDERGRGRRVVATAAARRDSPTALNVVWRGWPGDAVALLRSPLA